MSRYIEAETLKVSILRYAEKLLSRKRSPITKKVAEEVINDVCFAIEVQDSVDAVPVVHGHWDMKWPICLHQEIPSCSCCKKFVHIRSAYCPNCGAKMDEVTE